MTADDIPFGPALSPPKDLIRAMLDLYGIERVASAFAEAVVEHRPIAAVPDEVPEVEGAPV